MDRTVNEEREKPGNLEEVLHKSPKTQKFAISEMHLHGN